MIGGAIWILFESGPGAGSGHDPHNRRRTSVRERLARANPKGRSEVRVNVGRIASPRLVARFTSCSTVELPGRHPEVTGGSASLAAPEHAAAQAPSRANRSPAR